MTEHAPKLAALEAYVAELLSPSAVTRLERHLATCATCRKALEAVRAYAAVRDEAREAAVPTLSWEAFEQKLDAQASQPAPAKQAAITKPAPTRKNGRWVALAWPVLAVAATVLIAFIGLSGQREEARRAGRVQPPAAVAAEESPRVEGWVTLAAGDSTPKGADRSTVVREGDVLRTGAGAELHVALGGGSAVVLAAESELRVSKLRARQVELVLARGEVFSKVHKLAADERYVVHANGVSAHVRGTRFTVRARGATSVFVHEGRVEVMEGDRSLGVLTAGQRWPEARYEEAPVDRIVHGLDVASLAWPALELPALPDVATWHIDDAKLPAAGGLRMRVPAGTVSLAFDDVKGRMHTLTVDVPPEGTTLTESAVLDVLAADRRGTVGFLEPEQISPVVRGGIDRLRRCYERALRQDPRTAGKLVLALHVAPDGHVARAKLDAEGDLQPALESCVLAEARAWQFPRPSGGGSADFEVPLNFAPKR